MVDVIEAAFQFVSVLRPERLICWNNNNYRGTVLNLDGSCLGSPIRADYGGIIRNYAGFFLAGFSGYIAASTNVLLVELTTIHRGLLLAVEMDIADMICYSDSMLSVKLLTYSNSPYHAYDVLLQDIKDLLSSRNFSIHCYLR
ncbi:uncharacterized protein [Medicago truncatula]|uniref:uncharacterized protein n=1 Tax=Medicago truncatula TaxID=3880 RepID=UPI0000D607B5|nr:uncharacterized protein LOC112417299 [Medicago truncatula]